MPSMFGWSVRGGFVAAADAEPARIHGWREIKAAADQMAWRRLTLTRLDEVAVAILSSMSDLRAGCARMGMNWLVIPFRPLYERLDKGMNQRDAIRCRSSTYRLTTLADWLCLISIVNKSLLSENELNPCHLARPCFARRVCLGSYPLPRICQDWRARVSSSHQFSSKLSSTHTTISMDVYQA